ncbi:MAG: AI-2E family transporter [Actinomycetota bacterium]
MATENTQGRSLRDHIVGAGIVSWALIGILVLAYGAVSFLVVPLWVIFPPIAIAVLVVYLLNPLVARLQRLGVSRGYGVLIIYVLFLSAVVTMFTYLVPLLGRQLSGLLDELPRYANEIADRINSIALRRGISFRVQVPSDLTELIRSNRDTVGSFLGGVRTVAGTIVHGLVVVILGMVLSIYVLLDLPKIQAWIKQVIPASRRDEVLGLAEEVGGVLGGFFRGQLLVAAFVAAASAIGLTWVKLPFAVLIGLAAGIFNLIPLVGPFLAAVPAVAVGLLSDHPVRALYAAIVLLVVQQIDNHIVSPNVMGRTVRLHPITVMLALLAGGTIAGIPGMLAAIPTIASFKVIARYSWSRRHRLGVRPPTPPGPQPSEFVG